MPKPSPSRALVPSAAPAAAPAPSSLPVLYAPPPAPVRRQAPRAGGEGSLRGSVVSLGRNVVSSALVRAAGNTYEHITGKSVAPAELALGVLGSLVFKSNSVPGETCERAVTDGVNRLTDAGTRPILDMLFPKKEKDAVEFKVIN